MRYNPDIVIRGETDADIFPIENVTVAAFKSLAISNQTEQFIIKALRAAHALTISLVAEVAGRVVGHIAFSPVTLSDGREGCYGLGPATSATSEMASAWAARKALMMNCSVWLLTARLLNAAIVTFSMGQISASVSPLITMSGL